VSGSGSKGKFELTDKSSAKTKGAALKATINANGLLKATFTNENFGVRTSFGAIGATNTIPIEITVGNKIDGVNVISAASKNQKGSKFSMQYKLGSTPKGGASGTLAGAFILTSVSGKDDTKGGTGDAWKAAFLAVPPSGTSFGSVGSKATLSIGTGFSDTETITASKGTVKTGKIDTKTANKLTKLSMSDKGKGSYQTSTIASTLTGIGLARSATKSVNYGTEIDLGTQYSGAGEMAIFPKSSQWSGKNPSK
jgi:hypothetical protein